MTIELIDASGDALIFRKPDGSTLLNTADRQPAKLGELAPSVSIAWPAPAGSGIDVRIVAGGGTEFRYLYPAGSWEYTTDLGAAPAGYTPNFMMANINVTRSQSNNIYGFVYAVQKFSQGVNRPWNSGSMWVETIRTSNGWQDPITHRHMHIEIRSGRWVIVQKETSRSYASSWGSLPGGGVTGNAAATYTGSLQLQWGIFDL